MSVATRPVCILGMGYVGMACALGLAELGWNVQGYDIVPERIDRLARGIPPYREPGVEETLRRHLASGRVQFSHDLRRAARDAQVVIVAVGTSSREDGTTDAGALRAVLDQLAKIDFATWPTIVIRSSVAPGTSDVVAADVEHWADLIYAPEFLRKGRALCDFLDPDRIVVGCEQPATAVPYVRLLERLGQRVVFTSRCNAELIKSASNAFLALKISFASDVACVCDALGANSEDVLRTIGYDRRIGAEFMRPGIGFEGPYFEADLRRMSTLADAHGAPSGLYAAALRSNVAHPQRLIAMLEDEITTLVGRTIGVWGLSFKGETDDIRDSLAVRIVEELGRRSARAIVYDPAVRVAPLPAASRLAATALEATHCDALLVLTDWREFARIDPLTYARNVALGVVVDGRNVLDASRVAAAGLRYRGIGHPTTQVASRPHIATAGL